MRRLLGLILVVLLAASVSPAAAQQFRLLQIDGHYMKWGSPVFGDGAEVSYGFATMAESFADGINCREIAPAAALTARLTEGMGQIERIAAEAFAMWAEAANIVFRPAATGERADILIGAQGAPRRIAFANVWHDAGAAAAGVAPLLRATICLNPELAWSTRGRVPRKGWFDLRTVLAHEIGHAIGLDHPGATGALMGFRDQGTLTGLLPGDVAGVLALYGAAPRAETALR